MMPIVPFVLLWIAASIVIGKYGENTKLGSFGTFLISFFLSPLLGLLILWVAERRPRQGET